MAGMQGSHISEYETGKRELTWQNGQDRLDPRRVARPARRHGDRDDDATVARCAPLSQGKTLPNVPALKPCTVRTAVSASAKAEAGLRDGWAAMTPDGSDPIVFIVQDAANGNYRISKLTTPTTGRHDKSRGAVRRQQEQGKT